MKKTKERSVNMKCVGKVHQPGPNGLPMGRPFGDAWFGGLPVVLAPAPNAEMSEVRRPVSDTNQWHSLECSASVVGSGNELGLLHTIAAFPFKDQTRQGSLIRVLTFLST